MMAGTPSGELSLATMRPKGNLTLRLMFEGGWTVLTILGAVFALVGVGTVFLAVHLVSLEKRYEREGKAAKGTVVRKDTYTTRSRSSRGHHRTRTHYRVFYAFTAEDGTKHSGKGNIPSGVWRKLDKGSTIDVQYLPAEPAKHRPAAAREGTMVWLFVLFPVVFGGAGLVMLFIVGRRALKHASLLSNGTLTKGTVEEKTVRRDIRINNRHPYSIVYRFETPDGGSHSGKDLVLDQSAAAKMEPGTAIGVIYLPADPGKCVLFREKWMRYFHTT